MNCDKCGEYTVTGVCWKCGPGVQGPTMSGTGSIFCAKCAAKDLEIASLTQQLSRAMQLSAERGEEIKRLTEALTIRNQVTGDYERRGAERMHKIGKEWFEADSWNDNLIWAEWEKRK